MKKTRLYILSFILLVSIVLIGCGSGDYSSEETGTVVFEQGVKVVTDVAGGEGMELGGEILEVGFSKLPGDDVIELNGDDSVDVFGDVVMSAVKEGGVVNVSNPSFSVEVVYSDGTQEDFHLWVGEIGEKSTFMRLDDSHVVYTVSEEMTLKLMELVE